MGNAACVSAAAPFMHNNYQEQRLAQEIHMYRKKGGGESNPYDP